MGYDKVIYHFFDTPKKRLAAVTSFVVLAIFLGVLAVLLYLCNGERSTLELQVDDLKLQLQGSQVLPAAPAMPSCSALSSEELKTAIKEACGPKVEPSKPQIKQPAKRLPRKMAPPVEKQAAPKPASPVQPSKSGCKEEECLPTPKPTVQSEEKAKVCGIAIQKSVSDKEIIGRLQLDEDLDNPGKIRISKTSSFEGVGEKVAISPFVHIKDSSCNVDQATIYQHWGEVIKKFKLPLECVPVKLK